MPRYGIAVNPAAGTLDIDRKASVIEMIAADLGDCVIDGYDTESAEEYKECVKDLAKRADIILPAGGDGTFSDALDAIDEKRQMSPIPLGSGNALAFSLRMPYSLKTKKDIEKVSEKIKNGKPHLADLIKYNGKRAFLASVGIDGHVLAERDNYIHQGINGFAAYRNATIKSFFQSYSPIRTKVTVDEQVVETPKTLSVIVTKIPFYGYGLNMVPFANLSDGYLHVLIAKSGLLRTLWGITTSFLGSNATGQYLYGKKVRIETESKAYLQIDSTLKEEATEFNFEVIGKKLKLIS